MMRLLVTGSLTDRAKITSTLDGILKRNAPIILILPLNNDPARIAREWANGRCGFTSYRPENVSDGHPSHAVVFGEGEVPEGVIVMRVK